MSVYQVHLSLTYDVEAETENLAEAKAYETLKRDYEQATDLSDLFYSEVQPTPCSNV